MEILAQTGAFFRTKLMDLARAAAFARCIGANERFAEVTIETSTRAKSERKYFVQFQPASDERKGAILDRQQDARAERAATQGFTFCLDKDAGRPFFWCWSHTSGEVYETTQHSCNCPDHDFRCKPNGLSCKHILALDAEIARGGENLRTW